MITICGIAGFNLSLKESDIDVPKLARELLLGIEIRGRDATGAAWYEDGPNGPTLMVQKDGMKATHFVKWMDLPLGTTNCILHTRAGTKGSEKDNNNNHPVVSGNIVGVHNGVIWNDDKLFREMGLTDQRVGEVDTEAIFAAIAYGQQLGSDGKPLLGKDLEAILESIEGSAAIAWLEIKGDPDVLNVARISSSPLVVATTKGGSFLFGSTEGTIRAACRLSGLTVNDLAHVKEGVMFSVKNGEVIASKEFIPSYDTYNSWENYYATGNTGTKGYKMATGCGPKKDSVVRSVHAMGPPQKDEDEPTTQKEWSFNLSHYGLHQHVLSCLVADEHLSVMGEGEYIKEYRTRHEAIKGYIEKCDVEDALLQGCELQPGMWVTTYLGTEYENVDAQVWLMPQKFPGGTYILRAYIPNSRYKDGYEKVLVERMWGEFEFLSEGLQDVIGDLDSGEVLHPSEHDSMDNLITSIIDGEDPLADPEDDPADVLPFGELTVTSQVDEHLFHVEQDDKGEVATFCTAGTDDETN